MVRLREIPRTAAFAWSPDSNAPWVATGTKSGAVNVDFSNETCLELWDLALDEKSQGQELKPTATINTETGFHDLAWTQADSRGRGIVAGAFDSGSLGLWDAAKIIDDAANAPIASEKIHTGAIKALQFNPKITNFVATGGEKGELFITDLNNPGAPIRLGSTAARADDIDCLDWNKKVSNILVTGSSGGFVTVWDMRTKKESLILNNNGRKPASAVAWDPQNPTRLITAVPLQQEPVILVWDLRNSNKPDKVLQGHDSGVLSLSWCSQDSDLLLSSGQDNRTILWNPQTGVAYGDYPVVTNWTFQTRFNPHNPNFFATASLDGKIQVQSLQNNNPSQTSTEQDQAADGEDFFSRAPTQPQASSFSLEKAPKWLERPVSVAFGFGGRLITVRPVDLAKSRASKIDITKFEVDSSVGSATESFEKAIGTGDLTALCKERITSAKTDEERADWSVIQTLVSTNPRAELVKYLGFKNPEKEVADIVQTPATLTADGDDEKPVVNGAAGRGHKRFQSIWANSADGDFLSELAATKGTKTNNPFQIYTGSETEADRKITQALILGQFEKALDVCLKEDRISDAFMVAICGGERCIKKAQEAYFAKQDAGPNYLRLLASVVGKNLWDTVHNADLENWKEVMATLCTFADEKEFPDLCEALGDRLYEQVGTDATARKDASFCFLAGSKLEKVISIWIQELKEHEDSGIVGADATSAYSLHAHGLQDLIEKVTIFRSVVNFKDPELTKMEDWKLETLYSKYLEYADVVAASGQLKVAQKYLDILPTAYPGADVARTRIEQATKKKPAAAAAPFTAAAIPQSATPTKGRSSARPGYPAPQDMFSGAAATGPTPTPYAPQAPMSYASPTQAANPYAPPTAAQPAAANPYAPPQQARGPAMGGPNYGMPQASGIAPPPRQYNQSPSIPPPSQAKNMTSWNDVPDDFAKPSSRSRTPANLAAPPVASPFGQPAGVGSIPAPVAPPIGNRGKSPVPPPPKAGAPPRVTSPLSGQQAQSFDRPTSALSNPYAPPAPMSSPPVGHNIAPPPVGRVSSPYNAPPAGAPPPNRYAPAPGSQPTPQGPQPGSRPGIAPPPQGSSFTSPPPPSNPYAAPQSPPQSKPSPYGPGQAPQQTSAALPPPPQQQFNSGAPPGGPSQQLAERPNTASSGPEQTATPPARRHPKGDRSHIPAAAQPILGILSQEMARVEGRAPTSFKPQVNDTKKRLDLLYDHLNNGELLRPDTVQQIVDLANAMAAKDYVRAQEIQLDVHQNKVDECGQWMVGVKRLIGMSRATP